MASMPVVLKNPFDAVREAGRRYTVFVPFRTSATGPRPTETKVWTEVVLVFWMKRAAWAVSLATTRTPRPRAAGSAARAMAL